MRKYRAAAWIGGLSLLVLTWAWSQGLLKFRAEKIPYYCTKCKEVFIYKAREQVPIECDFCGENAALYGYYCKKCRRAYGLPSRSGAKKCTHCGSMLYAELTEELMEAYRTRMRDEREADQRGMRKSDIKIE